MQQDQRWCPSAKQKTTYFPLRPDIPQNKKKGTPYYARSLQGVKLVCITGYSGFGEGRNYGDAILLAKLA